MIGNLFFWQVIMPDTIIKRGGTFFVIITPTVFDTKTVIL
jgi:hypothetical protein